MSKEILNKSVRLTVGKSSFKGYGKIVLADKEIEPYIGKEVEIDIRIKEVTN